MDADHGTGGVASDAGPDLAWLRLGFERATPHMLGQALAGLSAYAKGVSLGIIEEPAHLAAETGTF